MNPALARREGEAGDVLVRTVPGVPTLRTAARAGLCLAVTVQLGAGHSAPLTPALVTPLNPLRPVTVPLSLQQAVQGALLLAPPLALAAVGPGTVDAGGGGVAGGGPGLALVQVPAGGGARHWVVVAGVPLPAGAVVPPDLVNTDTLPHTAVDLLSLLTLVHVLLTVVAPVARGALAGVGGGAGAAVVAWRETESCKECWY